MVWYVVMVCVVSGCVCAVTVAKIFWRIINCPHFIENICLNTTNSNGYTVTMISLSKENGKC